MGANKTFRIQITDDNKVIKKEIIPNETASDALLPNNFLKVLFAFVVCFAMLGIPFVIANLFIGNIESLFMHFFSNNVPLGLIIVLGIYTILFLTGITLIGEWAASYPSMKGVQPISREVLINSLKNLSSNVPVDVVEKQDGKIIFKWRYVDQRFKYLFGLGRISGDYTLTLKIPSRGATVYASETIKEFSFGVGGILSPNFNFHFSFFHGISLFTYDYAKGYGFTIKDGKIVFDKLYEYNFNPGELKSVIIALVTTNGWGYQPKVFLF